MLQNLIDALSNPAFFEHRPLKIYSRFTHALKILYFGIHLVDQEDTLQYQNQFTTLFRILIQVVYQSTEHSTLAQGHELASSGSSTTNQDQVLAQFIQNSSTELKAAVNTTTKACLEHIQKEDLGLLRWLEYEAWISVFRPEKSLFEDHFIEQLLILYMASQSIQDEQEINKGFYRIRQLNLVQKVRETYLMP